MRKHRKHIVYGTSSPLFWLEICRAPRPACCCIESHTQTTRTARAGTSPLLSTAKLAVYLQDSLGVLVAFAGRWMHVSSLWPHQWQLPYRLDLYFDCIFHLCTSCSCFLMCFDVWAFLPKFFPEFPPNKPLSAYGVPVRRTAKESVTVLQTAVNPQLTQGNEMCALYMNNNLPATKIGKNILKRWRNCFLPA